MQHLFLNAVLALAFGMSATAGWASDDAIGEAKCAGVFQVNKALAEDGDGASNKPASYWEDMTEKARALAFEAASDARTKDAVEVEIGEIATSIGMGVEKNDPETLAYLSKVTPRCEDLIKGAKSTQ